MGMNSHLWGIRFQSADPAVTNGFQDLEARQTDGKPFEEVISPSGWDCASSPTTPQDVTCAVRTTKNGLFGIRFARPSDHLRGHPVAGPNSGYQNLAIDRPPLAGRPSCTGVTGVPQNLTSCVVKGTKNEVFGVTFNPNLSNVDPRPTDILAGLGAIIRDPSCAPTPSILFAICAVIDGANHLQAILNAD